jgi:hypothetical protein
VLLERLIVNRPHPWGLLITFIELIKNPRYNFWSHNFCRCAAEVSQIVRAAGKAAPLVQAVAAVRRVWRADRVWCRSKSSSALSPGLVSVRRCRKLPQLAVLL